VEEIQIIDAVNSIDGIVDSYIQMGYAPLVGEGTIEQKKLAQRASAEVVVRTALAMSRKIGLEPLFIAQQIYIVHGKPSFSAKFLISLITQSGRFIRHGFEQRVDSAGVLEVRVWAQHTGMSEQNPLAIEYGPWLSMRAAEIEGWSKKNSKWASMGEYMLRNRAATLFVRQALPHLLMGFYTSEEMEDTGR
jgi:hypothetical protein